MRIVLTIDDRNYGHVPLEEMRRYIRHALYSFGGGSKPDYILFHGLRVEINILDDNVDVETGEITSDAELSALEKKLGED